MTERTLTTQEAEALVRRARERVAAKKEAKELKVKKEAKEVRGGEVNAYGETAGRIRIRRVLYVIGAPIAVPALILKALVNMRWV
jgi:hypothetical protein